MSYKTIAEAVYTEVTIKKSRFIAILFPINELKDIDIALQDARQKYPGANHYCYSYILRQDDAALEKCSDDGEPSGTAGWPMLNILKKRELQNTLAIVVRYFGGTLLGTGGLVRAYTQAVQSAFDICRLVFMEHSQRVIVELEYSYYGSFQNQILEIISRVADIKYTDKVSIEAWVALDRLPALAARVDQLTGGTAVIEYLNEGFIPTNIQVHTSK